MGLGSGNVKGFLLSMKKKQLKEGNEKEPEKQRHKCTRWMDKETRTKECWKKGKRKS